MREELMVGDIYAALLKVSKEAAESTGYIKGIDKRIDGMKDYISGVKTDLEEDIGTVKTDLEKGIGEVKKGIGEVRKDRRSDLKWFIGIIFISGGTFLGIIVSLILQLVK